MWLRPLSRHHRGSRPRRFGPAGNLDRTTIGNTTKTIYAEQRTMLACMVRARGETCKGAAATDISRETADTPQSSTGGLYQLMTQRQEQIGSAISSPSVSTRLASTRLEAEKPGSSTLPKIEKPGLILSYDTLPPRCLKPGGQWANSRAKAWPSLSPEDGQRGNSAASTLRFRIPDRKGADETVAGA